MFGLPPDLDLGFFTGRMLLQVCIGANEAILNFDGDISITITSPIACRSGARAADQRFDNYGDAAVALVGFIEKTVVSAKGEEDGTLVLTFQDDSRITLYDDSEHYESYTIKYDTNIIVV